MPGIVRLAMLLQAALNGDRAPTDHPAVPITPDQLAADAAACAAAGARAVHLHPRDEDGIERLDAWLVDAVVEQVRNAAEIPVGVSTGAWIEPDLERRLALIGAWRAPDYASVNLSEDGAERVMAALAEAGVGIEAGVWSVEDAERLAASGAKVLRVLVEPVDAGRDALAIVAEIHAALDRLGVEAPRLQHGDGDATWVLIEDAVRRGCDTRVGLEDTLLGPDGKPAQGNAALIRAARALYSG
jgi:uncharacterized protein (DUF849 family)